MQIDYHWEHPTGIIVAVATGPLSLEPALNRAREAWADPRFDPNRPLLCDLRDATPADTSTGDLDLVVELQRMERPKGDSPQRFAVLAESDTTLTFSRAYRSAAEAAPKQLDVGVFDRRQDAWDWSLAGHATKRDSGLRSLAACLGANPLEPPRSFVGLRVLVIEDDDDVRHILCLALQAAGALVSVAGSGEDAVALCNGRTFDAILLDYELPGMDGRAVFDQLDPGHRSRSILVTGADDREDVRAFVRREGVPCVPKPIDGAQLAHQLVRIAGER